MKKHNLFIISGPSGAGEDSVIDGLEKVMPIEKVTTTTTRKPRKGESEANPYYFINHEDFEAGIKEGNFVEYAKEYNDNYYGVTKQEIERINSGDKPGIWKIEYKGVKTAKDLFPDITAVFLIAPLETLERRIRSRSDVSDAYIEERMAYTKEWMKHTDIYDYTVNNVDGKLEESINQIKEIIESKQK